MPTFSRRVVVFDQAQRLLVQVRRVAELPLCEEAVHRQDARARHERRKAEGSEEEDAPVEDPRQALLEMATPWLTCARAQGMRTCG
jgi:hypothetical protein